MSAKTQQELIDLHWNEPQLEIIDRAIERIEKGHSSFCCAAINYCVRQALYEHKIGCGSESAIARLYMYQFALFCHTSVTESPSWWNSTPSPKNKIRRLEALRAFHQACIDAAKT